MDTKKSFQHVPNFYDGENVGRDSPAALLDMLAEVASQTLDSEKKQSEMALMGKTRSKSESLKRKNQDLTLTALQLLSMPATQLIKQFSIFTSDELKRQYSYVCALMPDCEQKYTSFASESRARMSIKAHLEDHLEYLKTDKKAYSSFTATAVKQKKSKTNLQSKKIKVSRAKKPQETLNKENKDVKSEKSTNYLRKILTNELKFPAVENQKENGNAISAKKDQEQVDVKVLGDHSYYEDSEEVAQNLVSADSSKVVAKTCEENIMLMVVQSDGVHMKEVPYVAHKTNDLNQEPIYLPDPVQTEEVYAGNMEVPPPAKPKGKAKFIGTSREEKEMALFLMDRIKKKGNPTGNNLQCRICDPPRTFTAPTTLVSHYRSHAGIKPYECRICRSVFTRRHSLKYHMLIHQNQTRFTCADCGKKFRHPSHFREHRRRHTGEAPFGCEDCGQRFKTRNTYKRHLKTRHGKVLTTSGELLHLSEEDFQKVRTSRKKKPDLTMESLIDEDMIAPEAILQYDDSNCDTQEDQNQDYKDYNQFVSDEGTVWMTENMMQVIKEEENYNNFEIENENDESRGDKTDFIETEVANVDTEFNSRHLYDEITQQVCNKEEESVILDGTVDADLNIAKSETQILYNEYESQIQNDVGEEILGYEEQILEDVDVQEVQIEEESESQNFEVDSSMNIFCSNQQSSLLLDSENPFENEALKIGEIPVQEAKDFENKEEEQEEGIFSNDPTFDSENNQESEELIKSEITQDADYGKCFLNNEQDNLQTELVFNLNLDQKEKVRVEPCGIPISQFQSQSAFQITKDGKMTLFGKQTQTINLMQNGKQSAILLLSNGAELTRNFFKINQNGILVKELKTLPIVAAPDK